MRGIMYSLENKRDTIVLYTTAVCNLSCRYCFIDKNPSLKEIDDLLDESFKGDYYFNFAKKAFKNPENLKEVQFWGGEPFLRIDRAYYTIEKLIEYFPNLTTFMGSTNFVHDTFFNQFFNLLKIFEQFPDRNFTFRLQLSLDGPKEITDAGRGKGVTDKFLSQFEIFLAEILKNTPKNVKVIGYFKPTLDNESFKKLISKEEIIKYFSFFDKLISKAKIIENKSPDNFLFLESKPNFATPSPHSTQDGIMFKDFIQLLIEVSKENKIYKYFENYDNVVLFLPNNYDYLIKIKNNEPLLNYCSGYTCNSGCGMVGLLPNNRISECHLGFTELLGKYKQYAEKNLGGKNSTLDFNLFSKNDTIQTNMTFDNLPIYENKIDCHWQEKTTFRFGNLMSQIQLLAYANQIDQKYKNIENCLHAAHFIQNTVTNCVRDNNNVTGSLYVRPIGELRLFFNGASDLIEQFLIDEVINNDK